MPLWRRSKSTEQETPNDAVNGIHNQAIDLHESKHSIIDFNVSRPAYNQDTFDRAFARIDGQPSDVERVKATFRRQLKCRVKDFLMLLPILEWLPKYDLRHNIVPDVVSGLTLAVVHIPQSIAFANIIPMKPVYGLYASLWPSFIYPIFGTALHASLGTYAVCQLMIRQSIEPILKAGYANATGNSTEISAETQNQINDAVLTLTFMIGVVQILMGLFRLHFIAAYLSDQLISAFSCASALIVITSQVNNVLNVKRPNVSGIGELFRKWVYFITSIFHGDVSYITILMSAVTIAVLILGKTYLNPPFKKRFKVPIPFEIIVVIIGTLVSYLIGLNEYYDVNVVGEIPVGLPTPRLPNVIIMPNYIGDSIAIGIVTFVVIVSMTKLFAKKHGYRIDTSQETYAIGLSNIGSSFFSGFAVCSALARCVLLSDLGPATQMSTYVTGFILLIVTLFMGPFFYALPFCVLASIIIVALRGLFLEFCKVPKLYHYSKVDTAIWVVTYACTVIFGVRDGLIASLAFALMTTVWRAQYPPAVNLGHLPGTDLYRNARYFGRIEDVPDVKIFRFDSPLMFINAELFRRKLYDKCGIDLAEARRLINEEFEKRQRQKAPPSINALASAAISIKRALRSDLTSYIVIDCSGFNYLDAQGLTTLVEVVDELSQIHVQVLLAHLKSGVRQTLQSGGFHDIEQPVFVNPEHIFPTIHDAVLYAKHQLNKIMTVRRKLTAVKKEEIEREIDEKV